MTRGLNPKKCTHGKLLRNHIHCANQLLFTAQRISPCCQTAVAVNKDAITYSYHILAAKSPGHELQLSLWWSPPQGEGASNRKSHFLSHTFAKIKVKLNSSIKSFAFNSHLLHGKQRESEF